MKQFALTMFGRRLVAGTLRRGVGHLGFAMLALALVSGCAASDHEGRRAVLQYIQGDYHAATNTLRPLAKVTNENFVLNNVRLGSAALARHDLDEAETAFLAAYEVLNSVGTNDGGRTAGAILVDEKLRIWRGEPYERAMANFYLGLIYYTRGDYANARGAFENSLFKLRDYGQGKDAPSEDAYQQVETNFALGYVMLAKSWQRLNEPQKAEADFARARQLRPDLAVIADAQRNARSNVLLVVDFGYGPRKVTDFDGAIVGFGPTPAEAGPVPPPVVMVDGKVAVSAGILAPPIDTLVLAQDRRWQSLDTWRTVKSAVGTGLIVAGAYEGLRSDNRNNQLAGLAMVGAGLLLKATSQADTRQWEMLPRTTFIIPLELSPGTHEVVVDFAGTSGLRQTWRGIVAPERGEAVYYIRTQRWINGPYVWPPPTIRGAPVASAELAR
jgi:tetratricopeptide (TPR) repeat protein